MHLPKYKRINVEDIDHSITSRISENEVVMWLASKLHAIRSEGLKASSIELTVNDRSNLRDGKPYLDLHWTMHGAGECAYTHDSLASTCADLREQIAGNPTERAAKKREEARRALKEAEDIESAAAGLRNPEVRSGT